jgi:hypothetical protein
MDHLFIGAGKTRIAWDRRAAANSVCRRGFCFELVEITSCGTHMAGESESTREGKSHG